jgi:hypothetical protein
LSWLVVASGQDASAHWVWRGLRARGHRCELLLTEALETAEVRWRHRIDARRTRVEATLADGRCLRSGDYSAVLNRTIAPPLMVMARMGWEDSEYARSEQIAFALSWLRGLAPVVANPPTSRGLAGAWRSPLEWRALARSAGLEISPLVADSHDPDTTGGFPLTPATGLVIGKEAFGSAAQPGVKAAAIRLAQAAETPMLGFWFSDQHRSRLMMATPHPDLTLGGERGLEAVERLLSR